MSKAEFILKNTGPDSHPHLSVELNSTYDERFQGLLKSNLRHNTERTWDPDSVRWFIAPTALDRAIDVAIACFEKVYRIEGDKITDCITGHAWENLNLFE